MFRSRKLQVHLPQTHCAATPCGGVSIASTDSMAAMQYTRTYMLASMYVHAALLPIGTPDRSSASRTHTNYKCLFISVGVNPCTAPGPEHAPGNRAGHSQGTSSPRLRWSAEQPEAGRQCTHARPTDLKLCSPPPPGSLTSSACITGACWDACAASRI